MKKLIAFVLLVVMAALSVSALAEDPFRIAVIYADTVNDKGWCESMDVGVRGAIADGYAIEYTPIESVSASDAANTLQQIVGDYDVIIAHGAQFVTAVTDAAEEYPEQIFAVGTSETIFGDNVFSYMPQSEEPGYLNGFVAGKLTKTGKVGIVGPTDGGDAARYVRGFVLGLQAADPGVQYMLSWTGSFSDTAGAGDIARTFIEAGCDVLTGASQQAVGAARVASDAGVLWVSQSYYQMDDFPAVTACAADYSYAAVVIGIVDSVKAGTTGGACIPLNYSNAGFVFRTADDTGLIPAEVQAAVLAARADMENGSLTPDWHIDVQ